MQVGRFGESKYKSKKYETAKIKKNIKKKWTRPQIYKCDFNGRFLSIRLFNYVTPVPEFVPSQKQTQRNFATVTQSLFRESGEIAKDPPYVHWGLMARSHILHAGKYIWLLFDVDKLPGAARKKPQNKLVAVALFTAGDKLLRISSDGSDSKGTATSYCSFM